MGSDFPTDFVGAPSFKPRAMAYVKEKRNHLKQKVRQGVQLINGLD